VVRKNGHVPVPGVTVVLFNPSAGFKLPPQITTQSGTYTFVLVAPGRRYILSAEVHGEVRSRRELDVAIHDQKLVLPDIELEDAATGLQPVRWNTAPIEMAQPAPVPALLAALAPPPLPPFTAERAEGTVETVDPVLRASGPHAAWPTDRLGSAGQAAANPPPSPRPVSGPTIQPEFISTTLGGVIDTESVHTLPLASRDFLDLALLAPGAYPVEQGSPLEGASLVVNGTRASMNNFLLDGADDNDYTINQSLPFQLVEAMDQFRVQASTSAAEFGRSAGAQINTISRSGANAFHGTLFEFNRNSALSAKNALSSYRGGTFDGFAQASRVEQILYGRGSPFPTQVLSDPVLNNLFQQGRNLPLNQNQFGANNGGPIKKDKAFFFFNWESFRADNPWPIFERVPDTTFRSAAGCASVGAYCNPQVTALYNLYPAPNVPMSSVRDVNGFPVSDPNHADSNVSNATAGFFGSGAFFVGDSRNFTNSDNLLGRVDFLPNSRVDMSFKYNIQGTDQVQGGTVPQTPNYPGSGIDVNGRNQNFSYNYVHQISHQAVNEFRFGWNRFRLTTLPLDHTLDPSSIFQHLNFTNKGFPTVVIGGFEKTSGPYADLGAPFNAPAQRANNVWSLADNLGQTRGPHLVEVGVELRHNRLNVNNEAAGRGLVTFDTVSTGPCCMGDFASIARVSPEFAGVNGVGGFDRSFGANSYDGFVQDTWRPRSSLSLNLGLRYEINEAPQEERNRLVNNYPGACAQFACLIRSGTNVVRNSNGDFVGYSNFIAPRAGFKTDFNNFGPHLGVAWSPGRSGRTVFRAGYAITFDQQSLEPSVNMLLNPPFVRQTMAIQPALPITFPAGFLSQSPSCGSSIWCPQSYSITARDPDTRTSYVHQFHFGIQRQLGNTAVLDIGYVGSAGHKLPRNRLLLQCTADVFNTEPVNCVPPLTDLGFGTGRNLDSVVNQENSANSNFNSLQVGFDARGFRGLTLHLHYQWARSLDNASSSLAPVFLLAPPTASIVAVSYNLDRAQLSALNNANPTLSLRPGLPIITTQDLLPNDTMNSANLAGQRASSDFDARHRFVADYIYDVPGWVRAGRIGGGWQLAGITTLQSGQPYSVFGDTFGVPLRPYQVGLAHINDRDPDQSIDSALPAGCNTTSLIQPCIGTSLRSSFNLSSIASFQPGSLPRNTFTGPGLVSFDFSVLKNTYLREGKNLQFRVEFFNLFNNVNFRQPFSQMGQIENVPNQIQGFIGKIPPSEVPNPFFGTILQARSGREIQFALKFIF
jgi:hypothetical protein